jgi:hypothetical protein
MQNTQNLKYGSEVQMKPFFVDNIDEHGHLIIVHFLLNFLIKVPLIKI